ncbi:TetR/AcrR family transcriptional regulator [Yoonia sp. 208BN28-4]|uniref:TetR/AcrR family transcriptional regulator n=1 Tax=Yoonia sp. 208BN28-4 TaxID=3126505 RepID=UPI0030A53989
MNARQIKILDAAQSVFVRYGVNRATMNDIAKEAGIARQTLYNAYPSKDDVLRAAVAHFDTQCQQLVLADWAKATTLGEKLDAFFAHVPLRFYDLAATWPDAPQMFEGLHAAAQQEMDAIATVWIGHFTDVVMQATTDDTMGAQRATDIAEFIYATSLNAKHNAKDRAAVETRLGILKQSVLALLGVRPDHNEGRA